MPRFCDCYDSITNRTDPSCPRCGNRPSLTFRREHVESLHVSRTDGNSFAVVTLNNGTSYSGVFVDSDTESITIRPDESTQREINVLRASGGLPEGTRERANYGRVTLNNQVMGIAIDIGDMPIGRVVGVNEEDRTYTAEINVPTALRFTSDTYRIYYKEFGKEEQKYGGTKHIGYDHWLDFLEGIKEHKNKGHKIVNLYSNKQHVTDDKKERLLKLI